MWLLLQDRCSVKIISEMRFCWERNGYAPSFPSTSEMIRTITWFNSYKVTPLVRLFMKTTVILTAISFAIADALPKHYFQQPVIQSEVQTGQFQHSSNIQPLTNGIKHQAEAKMQGSTS